MSALHASAPSSQPETPPFDPPCKLTALPPEIIAMIGKAVLCQPTGDKTGSGEVINGSGSLASLGSTCRYLRECTLDTLWKVVVAKEKVDIPEGRRSLVKCVCIHRNSPTGKECLLTGMTDNDMNVLVFADAKLASDVCIRVLSLHLNDPHHAPELRAGLASALAVEKGTEVGVVLRSVSLQWKPQEIETLRRHIKICLDWNDFHYITRIQLGSFPLHLKEAWPLWQALSPPRGRPEGSCSLLVHHAANGDEHDASDNVELEDRAEKEGSIVRAMLPFLAGNVVTPEVSLWHEFGCSSSWTVREFNKIGKQVQSSGIAALELQIICGTKCRNGYRYTWDSASPIMGNLDTNADQDDFEDEDEYDGGISEIIDLRTDFSRFVEHAIDLSLSIDSALDASAPSGSEEDADAEPDVVDDGGEEAALNGADDDE